MVALVAYFNSVHMASALLHAEHRTYGFHSAVVEQAPAPAPPPTTAGWMCSQWPTQNGTDRQRCENGNALDNGFQYMFNKGATASRNGDCGIPGCLCCLRVPPPPGTAPAPATGTSLPGRLRKMFGAPQPVAPPGRDLAKPVAPPPPSPGTFFKEVSELLTCPHLEEMVAEKCGSVPLFQSLPQFENSLPVCEKAIQTVPELGELFTRYFGPQANCKTRLAMWRFKGFDSAEKCFATTRTQSFAVTCRLTL